MTTVKNASLALICAFAAAFFFGCAQPSMTAEQWRQRVLAAPTPVLVEFRRPGCPNCKKLRPRLADLVAEYDGKVALYFINTDTSWDIVEANKIRRLPSVLLFVDGKEADRWVNELGVEPYRSALAERLAGRR